MNSKDRKRQKELNSRRNSFKMLALVTQFGINMLVPIFLCFFLGMYLDKQLGTNYLMILLFFVGAIAGFRNVYVLAMRTSKPADIEKTDDDGKDKEQ